MSEAARNHSASLRALPEFFSAPALPWLVLLFSLAATYTLWKNERDNAFQTMQVEFDDRVQDTGERIEQRMWAYLQVLRGVQGLFAASVSVERNEFRDFIDTYRLKQNYPGMQGIFYAQLLDHSSLDEHIAQVHREGLSDYAIHPAGAREVMSSIVYVEPFTTQNRRAFGYDMLTDATRRNAMEAARDHASAAATEKVTLIQETGETVQAGILIYLPVFRNGAPHHTVEQRQANLAGWVGAPFRVGDLLEGLLDGRHSDIDLQLYDGTEIADHSLLFDMDPEHGYGDAPGSTFQAIRRIEVLDRVWTMAISSLPAFDAQVDHRKPQMILVAGLGAALLLSLLTWLLQRGQAKTLEAAQALSEVNQRLQDAEERWRFALEGAGNGVWDADFATGKIFLSNRCKEILGYSGQDLDPDLAEWLARVHPQDRGPFLAERRKAIDGVARSFVSEHRHAGQGGAWKWVEIRGMLVSRDEHGKPLRMIGTCTDISQRKRAEEEIHELNLSLEQRVLERTEQLDLSNRELQAFSYSVSHDLRAPLRGIDGWSQALLEDYGERLDEEGRQYLDRVRSETQRMGQLIDDLLQLSRVTQSELRHTEVDLSAIAQDIVARLYAADPARRVQVRIEPGLKAIGDPGLLHIALTNLLDNAWKFTSGRDDATIEFHCAARNGKTVYVVADNGAGFDMDSAQKLFSPFQRMHRQSEFPGTGIGLATVQRVVRRHGGQIWAEAAPGAGARFYFTLKEPA